VCQKHSPERLPKQPRKYFRLNGEVTKKLQCIADTCLRKASYRRPSKKIDQQTALVYINHKQSRTLHAKSDRNCLRLPWQRQPKDKFLPHQKIKNTYKNLVNRAKTTFFDKLNSLSNWVWKNFKLEAIQKTEKGVSVKFDCYTMEIVQKFFRTLRKRSHDNFNRAKTRTLRTG
jgi:hypothetical protein